MWLNCEKGLSVQFKNGKPISFTYEAEFYNLNNKLEMQDRTNRYLLSMGFPDLTTDKFEYEIGEGDVEVYCANVIGHIFQDLTAPTNLEIAISNDSKIVWINTENGCVFRACRIGSLSLRLK